MLTNLADGVARAYLQGLQLLMFISHSWIRKAIMTDVTTEKLPTKFAEDLLLFIPRGEEDFGVKALGLEALPWRGLGAGSVPGIHLNVQVDLE